MTPADRERRKEALEWAVEFLEDAFTEHPHAATLREMLEEMEAISEDDLRVMAGESQPPHSKHEGGEPMKGLQVKGLLHGIIIWLALMFAWVRFEAIPHEPVRLTSGRAYMHYYRREYQMIEDALNKLVKEQDFRQLKEPCKDYVLLGHGQIMCLGQEESGKTVFRYGEGFQLGRACQDPLRKPGGEAAQ